MIDASQPFARDQGRAFSTEPFLGGCIYLLPAGVAAGGVAVIPHTLRAFPRYVIVLDAGIGTFPSRVCFSAKSPTAASVIFESATPAGAAVWMW